MLPSPQPSTATLTTTPVMAFDTSILAGQLAESSLRMYTRDFRAYLAFAGGPEMAMQASTLARWRNYLSRETTLSPHTINRMLSAVKRLMKEAATQNYLSQDLAAAFHHIDGVKVEALKKRTKAHARTRIAPDAMRELTQLPDSTRLIGLRDQAMLHTFASSGLRVSELANLTLDQIEQRDGGYVLRIMGKNDIEFRDAHLSPTAYQSIMTWIQARPVGSEYIFTSFARKGDQGTSKPMSEVAVWKVIKGHAERLGLAHVKPHDLRRFVGTQLAKVDIRKAQKAMGHKRIDTTAKHYVLDDLEVGLTDHLY